MHPGPGKSEPLSMGLSTRFSKLPSPQFKQHILQILILHSVTVWSLLKARSRGSHCVLHLLTFHSGVPFLHLLSLCFNGDVLQSLRLHSRIYIPKLLISVCREYDLQLLRFHPKTCLLQAPILQGSCMLKIQKLLSRASVSNTENL